MPDDQSKHACLPLHAACFFLALSAWSWGSAFVCHQLTLFEITPDMNQDGTPIICYDGLPRHSYTPRWYALPLIGNILGGYIGLVVYGVRRWGG